jgi:hypothetical protein
VPAPAAAFGHHETGGGILRVAVQAMTRAVWIFRALAHDLFIHAFHSGSQLTNLTASDAPINTFGHARSFPLVLLAWSVCLRSAGASEIPAYRTISGVHDSFRFLTEAYPAIANARALMDDTVRRMGGVFIWLSRCLFRGESQNVASKRLA